jgi:putative SOS response-associated peptidase YedK
MCGRYAITTAPEAMRQLFGYMEQPNFPARYNIAPTQPVPIVRLHQGQRQFALVRWGLLPAWVKDPKKFSLVHVARSESVNEKPAFRNAMKRRRCLVPADGFYEWSEFGERKRPFLLGAIAERMPAILPPGAFDLWLDCAAVDAETATAFLVPAPEALLEAYPVSTAVNRTANDSPELIVPVSAEELAAPEAPAPKRKPKPKPDDRQPSLFDQ